MFHFPIDLDAGITRDPGGGGRGGDISKLIKDVCLRFACFSCLIERVAIFAFIVKKKRIPFHSIEKSLDLDWEYMPSDSDVYIEENLSGNSPGILQME